jgi:hypothetical protein
VQVAVHEWRKEGRKARHTSTGVCTHAGFGRAPGPKCGRIRSQEETTVAWQPHYHHTSRGTVRPASRRVIHRLVQAGGAGARQISSGVVTHGAIGRAPDRHAVADWVVGNAYLMATACSPYAVLCRPASRSPRLSTGSVQAGAGARHVLNGVCTHAR